MFTYKGIKADNTSCHSPDSSSLSLNSLSGTYASLLRWPLHPLFALCCCVHARLQVRALQAGHLYLCAAAWHTSHVGSGSADVEG